MAKDVQRYAVTTVLEAGASVIISLVLVTLAVIQDIREICVHKVRFSNFNIYIKFYHMFI